MFDAVGVGVLVGRLGRVLVAMTADPGRLVSSIDLLDSGEHARLDEVGNRAALTAAGVVAVSIPVLFAAQVARAPEAVAISDGQRSWTYRELDVASNQVAHLLAGHGVGAGSGWRWCCRVRVRRSSRCWGCLSPGRPMCRSTRPIPTRASGSCSMTPRRWRCTTEGLRSRLAGHDVVVIDIDDPL